MPIIPTNGQVDPIFLGIGIAISLIVVALFFKHERDLKKKNKVQELSNVSIDNVQTIAWAISCQIEKCKEPKDFNEALKAIARYEWEFEGDNNAKREANILKELLDIKISNVYGVQTIF